MAQSPPRNQPGRTPKPQRQAPGPLLALMAVTIAIFMATAFLLREWVYLFLGGFCVLAALVPFFTRR